ncbi:MAG: Hsp20/alpha crystallin family protein [Marinilabilia sp.]
MKFLKKKIGDKIRVPGFIEKFFGKKLSDQVAQNEEIGAVPSVNIADRDKSYNISVALPGLDKKDVNLEVDGNYLTISSEKSYENKDEDKNWLRQEYHYASFFRRFELPEDADPNKIEAKMKNGVLNIEVGRKSGKKGKEKTIKVD